MIRPNLNTLVVMEEVMTERLRQIEHEGWLTSHDDRHTDNELTRAAACYAFSVAEPDEDGDPKTGKQRPPFSWPFSDAWWKPTTPLRDLTKATALLVAEMERRLRAGEKFE